MTLHRSRRIPLGQLVEADWNANRVPPGTLKKIRESINRYGVVENLVARAHPTLPEQFEVLSGNHRLRILRDLGHQTAPVVVVNLDDAHARLLAETLNNTRGQNDPQTYAALIDQVLATVPVSEATAVLPETEVSLDRLLRQFKPAANGVDETPPPAEKAQVEAKRDLRARVASAHVW